MGGFLARHHELRQHARCCEACGSGSLPLVNFINQKLEIIFYEKTDDGGRLKVDFKFKKEENCEYELQVFIPEDFYKIEDYFIVDNQIHLRLENTRNNVQIVKVYNFKTGNLLKEIELK